MAKRVECRFGATLHERNITAAFRCVFTQSEHIVENMVVECVETSGVAQCRIDAFGMLSTRRPARFPQVCERHAHKSHPADGHCRIFRNFGERVCHIRLCHRLPHRFEVGSLEQLPVQRTHFGAKAQKPIRKILFVAFEIERLRIHWRRSLEEAPRRFGSELVERVSFTAETFEVRRRHAGDLFELSAQMSRTRIVEAKSDFRHRQFVVDQQFFGAFHFL